MDINANAMCLYYFLLRLHCKDQGRCARRHIRPPVCLRFGRVTATHAVSADAILALAVPKTTNSGTPTESSRLRVYPCVCSSRSDSVGSVMRSQPFNANTCVFCHCCSSVVLSFATLVLSRSSESTETLTLLLSHFIAAILAEI